jgi:general secretion pathway protein H
LFRRARIQRFSRLSSQRGLSLVEVLIVVALIALMSAGVLFGSGMLGSGRQRQAATLVLSGVRLGMARANSTGRPVRMVFDLDKDRVALEEAKSGKMLREKEKDNTGGGAEAATEAEQKARAEAERILEGPRAPRAEFTPVKQFGFDGDDAAGGREFPAGVQFRSVQTEHDEDARTEGRGYLYFWPGGGTERAAIQIGRGDDVLTVLVSPLTGRAKIEKGAVKLEAPKNDSDFGELEGSESE